MANYRIVLISSILLFNNWILCLDTEDYAGYKLIKVVPTNKEQIEALTKFNDPEGKMEIFKRSRGVKDSMEVLVPPGRLDYLKKYVDQHGIDSYVMVEDYRRQLEETVPQRRSMGFGLMKYNSYDDIQGYLDYLAAQYPNLVKLQHVGNSYEGRPMKLVRVSSDPFANNPAIFIDAGIHAREWVAPATALYLLHSLVENPETSKTMLNGVDWLILPVVNPDGYEYTRMSPSQRLWRKTRSRSSNGCYGVDGNRNYGFQWAVTGTSKDPCDKEIYPGAQPFSEVETRIVRSIMLNNPQIKLYISLHAYGNYLVYPWGFTGKILPKRWQKLNALARRASDAIYRVGGPKFNVMSAGQWYPAAGGSDDFAYAVPKIPYVYTMELTDGYNFVFPEHLLESTLPKFLPGFKEFAQHIRYEFGGGGIVQNPGFYS